MPYLGIEVETLKTQVSHLKSASLDLSKLKDSCKTKETSSLGPKLQFLKTIIILKSNTLESVRTRCFMQKSKSLNL